MINLYYKNLPNKVLTNDLKPCSLWLTDLSKPPPTLVTSPTLINAFCMTSHVRNQMCTLCSYKDVGALTASPPLLLLLCFIPFHNTCMYYCIHDALSSLRFISSLSLRRNMESCCTALNQIQPQLQNSFRIDSILTGMGGPPPQAYSSSAMQQHSSNGPAGGVEALKQFGNMFGKNEELHIQERKRGNHCYYNNNENRDILFSIIIIIIVISIDYYYFLLESVSSADDDEDSYRKKKKPRTAFSREQVSELEKKFTERKYLSSAERGELAEKLKLSDMQVKTWFQNRRMKFKRQNEEAELEVKSPKFPYPPFVPYSSFYSYTMPHYKMMDQMQQQQQSPSYTCTSPPSTSESYHQSTPGPAPLVLGTNPAAHHISPSPHITSTYFNRAAIAHGVISNGSQSPCYHIGAGYLSDYNPAAPNGPIMSPPYCNSSGSSDWQRSPLPTPPAAP